MLTFPPDISFVIQILSFLVLWAGLKRLLFDPMLHVLEERESRTSGVRHLAAEMTAAAEQSAAEHERRLHEVRLNMATEAQAARDTTQAAERQVITEARQQANAQLTQLRENLSHAVQAARPGLVAEARDLAALMTERVVGRRVA